MTLSIKNIQITTIDAYKKNLDELATYVDIYNKQYDEKHEIKSLIPQIEKHNLSFEIHNTNSNFANMIRRVMEDEVENYSLTFEIEDFEKDDIFVLYDLIKQRIEAIPISNELTKLYYDKNNKVEIYLDFTNKTSKKAFVLSSDIKIKVNDKLISTNQYFEQNVIILGDSTFVLSPETKTYIGCFDYLFRIAYEGYKIKHINNDVHISKYFLKPESTPSAKRILDLLDIKLIPDRSHMITYRSFDIGFNPAKTITIKKISIVKGINKDDSNAFPLVANIGYEVLEDEKETKLSSLTTSPNKFKLSFNTYGNYKPHDILHKVCETIIKRMQRILNNIKTSIESKKTIPFVIDNIEMTILSQNEQLKSEMNEIVYIFTMIDEYWTFATVISKYIYLLNPKIKFVTYGIKHPDIERGIVKLVSDDPLKEIYGAIEKIIIDVTKVDNAF